jgi:hypothetical protein
MYFYQYSILEYPVLLILSSLFIHQHLWSETEKSELPQDSSKSVWFPQEQKSEPLSRLGYVSFWWSQRGSDPRPPRCERGALPAELWPQNALLL